ncbi:MAG: hypothetical protein WBC44_18470, partial [Planctomycetaceae bacterium]
PLKGAGDDETQVNPGDGDNDRATCHGRRPDGRNVKREMEKPGTPDSAVPGFRPVTRQARRIAPPGEP